MSTYGYGYDYDPDTKEFPPQEAKLYSHQVPYSDSDTYHDQDFAPVSRYPEYRMETPESGAKAKRLKKVGKWIMVLSVLGLMTSLSELLLMITFITGIVFYVRGKKALKRWNKQETIRMAHFFKGVPPEQFY